MPLLMRLSPPAAAPSPQYRRSHGGSTTRLKAVLPETSERMFLVARHASSSTDAVRPRSDNFDIANGHGHFLIKSTSDLQEAVSSCFGKALVTSSAVMLAMPPSCLAEECDPGYSLPNMPLLFAIAMVGATVGGLLARQRKGELKKLNDQLRQINASLRRQAKIESYAPALSYAPAASKIPESEVIVDPHKQRLLAYLRTGKNYLRNQAPDKAFSEFKAALDLAQSLGDHVEEKKAARGLGASLQRQGNYKEAIKYHSMVLSISKMTGEDSGVTEAYGAIADCYTEVGELEKAGKFYDEYIARLEND
ncbi:protein FLUORESCENT IN BLUE LIGHT, chloroplastic-like isoform X1 [Triticum dicoccoides]|uniref:protein FLUORESCENT IN BLUE LIGHT, chloroplastic-like isoform X1 n=1 Tax=Triticum dicoccoides TaxID=85692 RepID=UPI0018906B91|nr:protein FLUORESCENT IN BLUE LIGHT, chloroplastic-like isoform X1 [Triticum dicoccoides]XP_037440789.1 protein FLUORESCENT IN BLUE LIGHT, chloroplastic-like isoform X1 [Triticum dicoccoides]